MVYELVLLDKNYLKYVKRKTQWKVLTKLYSLMKRFGTVTGFHELNAFQKASIALRW